MKVGGAGRARGTQSTSKSGKARQGSGERFSIEAEESVSGAAGTGPAAAAAPVDALLALQEVKSPADDGQPGGRKRAVARAEDMLDILEDIRISLLAGGLPKSKLDALVKVVSDRRNALQDRAADPRLAHVLDEIELRAQVELAKYETAMRG